MVIKLQKLLKEGYSSEVSRSSAVKTEGPAREVLLNRIKVSNSIWIYIFYLGRKIISLKFCPDGASAKRSDLSILIKKQS